MPYLSTVYFQGVKKYSDILNTPQLAVQQAKKHIDDIVNSYPAENQNWARCVSSYVITPEEQILLPNYNLQEK